MDFHKSGHNRYFPLYQEYILIWKRKMTPGYIILQVMIAHDNIEKKKHVSDARTW